MDSSLVDSNTMMFWQGIPRTILFDNKTGTHLLQWPVEEIESLRQRSHAFNNLVIQPGSVVPLEIGSSSQVCFSNTSSIIANMIDVFSC